MPKSSHIAPNSYSPRNESCENNNMRTNVSEHFKELNDMRGNLRAVKLPTCRINIQYYGNSVNMAGVATDAGLLAHLRMA